MNSQGNKRKTPSVCQGDGVIRQDSNLVAAKLEYEDVIFAENYFPCSFLLYSGVLPLWFFI